MAISEELIGEIRDVSRALVREWGFMDQGLAGTDLSPSAVHALVEIDKGCLSARALRTRLGIDKSSISRMLRRLVEAGDVSEDAGDDDGRVKRLSLTKAGCQRVAAIHAFADRQVADALQRLAPGQDHIVLHGLKLYADALGRKTKEQYPIPEIQVVQGYRTGLIARITDMHARYYSREAGLGQQFEALVAGGMADLCNRLGHPRNAIWAALRDNEIIGSVAIDGEDLGETIAHLRCFIVDDSVRGGGAGRKLLSAALAFVDAQKFPETHLETFAGLSAARHLYESFGFVCVEERVGTQWGKEVMEQRFVRRTPGF